MSEEVDPTSDILRTKQRRLQELKKQAAFFGPACPPHITMEIQDLGADIAQLEGRQDSASLQDTPSSLDQVPQQQSTSINWGHPQRRSVVWTGVLGFLILISAFAVWRVAANKTSQTLPSPSMTASETMLPPKDSTAIIRITPLPRDPCNEPAVLPASIAPDRDRAKALAQFNQEAAKTQLWQRAPSQRGSFTLGIQVSSIVDAKQWIRLDSKVLVTVHVGSDVPEHVNIVQDCAGLGQSRIFPTIIPLKPSPKEYNVSTSYPNTDYFTLQPGEFEVFQFGLRCDSPGIYISTLTISYTYLERSDVITLNSPDFVCPKSYTSWSFLDNFEHNSTYVWNGNGYSRHEAP